MEPAQRKSLFKDKSTKRMLLTAILWIIVGIMAGMLIGFLFFEEYIMNYTNECMTLYRGCLENCNGTILISVNGSG